MRPATRLLFLILIAGCRPADGGSDAGTDTVTLRAVNDAYRSAWLAGDSAAVLRLFTSDAVLLPHHGDPPVVGLDAIRQFWWPADAPPTTITTLELTTEGARADGLTAVLWGRFTLAFSFEAEGRTRSLRNSGTYLMMLRRDSVGADWRITHRMWDDPVAQQE